MGKIVTGLAALWTAIFGIAAMIAIIDAIGSFGWGMKEAVWVLIGVTIFGCGFVWRSRRWYKG